VDIKVIADNSKARKHKRAIGKFTSTLTGIDRHSGYLIGFLLQNHVHLETTLEKLRLEIYSKHRILQILRIDNQFITEPIREWAQFHHITLLPCIPHEHHSIGEIERFHRTLQDGNSKQLYNKPHLNISYIGGTPIKTYSCTLILMVAFMTTPLYLLLKNGIQKSRI
jgi:hypothetical protein